MDDCEKSGRNVWEVFRNIPENPNKSGGRPKVDLHLSRYACHLIVVAANPRTCDSLEDLDDVQALRCVTLQEQPDLLRCHTRFSCWTRVEHTYLPEKRIMQISSYAMTSCSSTCQITHCRRKSLLHMPVQASHSLPRY